jgi:hypothetical protein
LNREGNSFKSSQLRAVYDRNKENEVKYPEIDKIIKKLENLDCKKKIA